MNSSLYQARIMHHRLEPKKHSFQYDIFMFYLDLDELDELSDRLKFMSRNRFNLFTFKDREHLQLPRESPDNSKNIKQHICRYLAENGITEAPERIMLLTNLSTLGYNFNPVSFYFCFDQAGLPLCAVAEIGNTFGEMKPFLLGKNEFDEGAFRLNTTKYFYVSPFFDHDTQFDFNLQIPEEKLQIRIDDYKEDRRVFISTLSGIRKPLNDLTLLRYFFSFPLVTLKVITLIHWNALKLILKKIPYRKKEEHPELQQEVYKKYKSSGKA
jgi:DUF1365 family protein